MSSTAHSIVGASSSRAARCAPPARRVGAPYRLDADLAFAPTPRGQGVGDDDLDGQVDGAAKVTCLLVNNPAR